MADKNPPAFPNNGAIILTEQNGMTLRDWFAGMALANGAHSNYPSMAAQMAYQTADAMLAEREKTNDA